jgi:hypothetical protein
MEPDSGRTELIHPTDRHDPAQPIIRFKRQSFGLGKNPPNNDFTSWSNGLDKTVYVPGGQSKQNDFGNWPPSDLNKNLNFQSGQSKQNDFGNWQYNLNENTQLYVGSVTRSPFSFGDMRPKVPQREYGIRWRFRRQTGEIGGSHTLLDSRKHRVDGSVFERQNIPEGAQP